MCTSSSGFASCTISTSSFEGLIGDRAHKGEAARAKMPSPRLGSGPVDRGVARNVFAAAATEGDNGYRPVKRKRALMASNPPGIAGRVCD